MMPESQPLTFEDGSFSGVTLIPVEIAFDELSDDLPIESVDPKRAALLATPVFAQLPQPTLERLIAKMELVERSEYVPRDSCEPPVPAWKRSEWARDVLPARQP